MAKILIVEDEEGIQHLLQRIVSMLGHTCVVAGDGTSALDQARDPELGLIISDLSLPGKPTGEALILQLRALQPACPMIISTGYSAGDHLLQSLKDAGVLHILGKPFDLLEARALIASLVGNARKPT